jgi:hypothetical protein
VTKAGNFTQNVVTFDDFPKLQLNQVVRKRASIADTSHVPAPLSRGLDVAALRQPQDLRSGINAVIGRWPGDESDEEVTAALFELS